MISAYRDTHLIHDFNIHGSFVWYHCAIIQVKGNRVLLEYRYPFERATNRNTIRWFYKDEITLVVSK